MHRLLGLPRTMSSRKSALAPLIEIARNLARIEHYTGCTAPSVVT